MAAFQIRAEQGKVDMDLLAAAHRHIEAENHHNIAKIMQTIADGGADYMLFPNDQQFSSREAIKDFYAEIAYAVPDMHVQVDNIFQDQDSRQVCVQYTFTGTHKRAFWGLAPTHKPLNYHGCILYAFDAAGKLTREIGYFDKTEILTSLGIIRDTNTTLGQFLLIFFQSPIYTLKSGLRPLFVRQFETDIMINASAEAVWNTLTNFRAFSDWNPSLQTVQGMLNEGDEIKLLAISPSGAKHHTTAKIIRVDAPRELRWLGGSPLPFLFQAERYFLIEPLCQSNIRFVQGEIVSGLAVPFRWKKLNTDGRLGYENMNIALKKRAEEAS